MNNQENIGARYARIDFVASGTTQYYLSGVVIPSNATIHDIIVRPKTAFVGSTNITICYRGVPSNTAPVYGSLVTLFPATLYSFFNNAHSLFMENHSPAITVSGDGEVIISTDGTSLSGACTMFIEYFI